MEELLIRAVKGYQRTISPMFPPSCRYYPTCSTYTIQAIEKHGALKGTLMGSARIARCNPFAEGGFDFVPEHFSLKKNPDEKKSHPSIEETEKELTNKGKIVDKK